MPHDVDEDVHRVLKRSRRKTRATREPLAIAVFEDAVRTLQRCAVANDRATRTLVAEIDAWFACDDCDHSFTLASICKVLALNVAHARSGLRERRESRRVMLRTEPRLLGFAGRRRSEERGIQSRLRVVPGASHVRGPRDGAE
jgi:hypothetical protein